MNKLKLLTGVLLYCVLLGCQVAVKSDSSAESTVLLKGHLSVLSDRDKLYQLFIESEIANPLRSIVHLSHVCNLIIDQQQYGVVDLRELVKGAVVARGVNQVIVLNQDLQPVKNIEYARARPLFCKENKLYLHGNIIVDGQSVEGNVLQYEDFGFKVNVFKEDINAMLPQKKK